MKYIALLLLGSACTVQAAPPSSGWGTDSRILSLQLPERQDLFLQTLQDNGITLTREALYFEDQLESAPPMLEKIQQHGLQTVCVFPWKDHQPPTHTTGWLEPDLMKVYHKARRWGQTFGDLIPVWELANEPDIGFVRAMPDQYAAWSKAAYLGFKSVTQDPQGNTFTPTVLMGSQSLPPGPWLQRAAANDLLFYTDAYNQHFYGHPENFASFLQSIRATLSEYHEREQLHSPELPLWITECGLRIAPEAAHREDSELRQRQADYFAQTAQVAAQEKVAVFMPYSLYAHREFSLIQKEPFRGHPAWKAYRDTIQSHPLSHPKVSTEKTQPPSVICQWRPAAQRSLPYKTRGSYRFRNDTLNGQRSMSGDMIFYNFSDSPVTGAFSWDDMPHVRMTVKSTDPDIQIDLEQRTFRLTLPAMSSVAVPVLFFTYESDYFYDTFSARFTRGVESSLAPSRLHFHLETTPDLKAYETQVITGRPPLKFLPRLLNTLSLDQAWNRNDFAFDYIDRPEHVTFTSVHGPWLGVNRVEVGGPWLNPLPENARPGEFSLNQQWLFTPHEPLHLKSFPMAITQVDGLPDTGFLVLQADRNMAPDKVQVRVDLIDKHQRRFTIAEFQGKPYYYTSSSVLLNIKDFHPYFWGHHSPESLDPAEVREIQLRFYYAEPHTPAGFRLYWITPHSYNTPE